MENVLQLGKGKKPGSTIECTSVEELSQVIEKRLNRYPPEIRKVLMLCFCSLVYVFKEVDVKYSLENVSTLVLGEDAQDEIENNITYSRISSIPFGAVRIFWQELLDLQPEEMDLNHRDKNKFTETILLSKTINDFTFTNTHPWRKFLTDKEYEKFCRIALSHKSTLYKRHAKDEKDKNPFEKFFKDIAQNLQDNNAPKDANAAIEYIRDQLVALGLIKIHHCEPRESSDAQNGEARTRGEVFQKDWSSRHIVKAVSGKSVSSRSSYKSNESSKSGSNNLIVREIMMKKRFDFLLVKSDLHYQFGLQLCQTPIENKGFQFADFNSTYYFLCEVMAAACLRQRERLESKTYFDIENDEKPNSDRNLFEAMLDDASVLAFRLLPSFMMRSKRFDDAIAILQAHSFLNERINVLKIEEAIFRTQLDHKELRIRQYQNPNYDKSIIETFASLKDCLLENLHTPEENDEGMEKLILEAMHELAITLDVNGFTNEAIQMCNDALIYEKSALDPMSMTTAETLQLLGNFHSVEKRSEEAVKVLTEALEILKFNLGRENEKVISLCKKIAILYGMTSDYKKSIFYYEDALMAQMKLTGKKSTPVAEIYCSLGVVQNILNQFDKAIFCYKEAIRIMDLPEEGFDAQGSFIHYNIGNIYSKKGDCNSALEHYRQSLNYEQNSTTAAKTLFAMGTTCIQADRLDDALTCFEQSLEIRRDKSKGNEKDIAQTILSMARVYCDQGIFDKSLSFYQEANALVFQLNGERKEYISVLRNIAYVFSKKGEYDNAASFYEKALEICKRVYGNENTDVADILYERANVSYKVGSKDEAMGLYQESLAIRTRIKGEKDPDVIAAKNNLGVLNLKLHQYEVALEYFNDVLTLKKETGSEETEKIADVLQNIGLVYKSLKAYDEALQNYEEALRIRELKLGSKHPKVFDAIYNIGIVLVSQGKFDSAMQSFESCLEGYKGAGYENDHPSIKNANRWIDFVNRKMDKPSSIDEET